MRVPGVPLTLSVRNKSNGIRILKTWYARLCNKLGYDPRSRLIRGLAFMRRPIRTELRSGTLLPLTGQTTVLVIRKYGIGNGVLVMPLLQNLRRCLPDARICLAASPAIIELLRPSGLCHEFLSMPDDFSAAGSLWRFWRIVRCLNNLRLNATFVAYPDYAEDIAVLRSFVRFGVTVGVNINDYTTRSYDVSLPWNKNLHEAEANINLAKAVGIPVIGVQPQLELTSMERAWAESIIRDLLPQNVTRIAMHCGAEPTQAFKAWPLSHYRRLIKLLTVLPSVRILLFGGKGEAGAVRILSADCEDKVIDFVGKFSIRQTAALVAQCQVMVGGDTGLMHLASAVGVPVCAIFGPTNPNRSRPGYGGEQVDVIRGRCDCGNAYHFGHPFTPCPTEWSCVRGITPNFVLATVVKRLGSGGIIAKRTARLC
jgi:ADP-heptose:LPS heptosyltransferase